MTLFAHGAGAVIRTESSLWHRHPSLQRFKAVRDDDDEQTLDIEDKSAVEPGCMTYDFG